MVDRGFDTLWATTQHGSVSWVDRTTTAERAWFDALVDEVVARDGTLPQWNLAVDLFADEFGVDRAPSPSTMAKHVRAALKARDDG